MFPYGKLIFYIKQHFPTADWQYTLTPIAATRIVAGIMVVSLLLPLPWFTLSGSSESVAGTRLLSYAFDGFTVSFLFSISPAHTALLFTMPFAITVLSLMTLSDAILSRAANTTQLSVLNIIAMLLLMYAATVAADLERHVVGWGVIVLPKWGLWLTFLLAVGLVTLSTMRTMPNLGDFLDNCKQLIYRR